MMENYNQHKIHKHKNGNIQIEEYFLNNKYHRLDGPAEIWYFQNGNISAECYFINGKRHRTDGPSYTGYDSDGTIITQIYRLNDNLHRIDGPAHTIYDEKIFESYYLFGFLITKEEFYTPGFIDSYILENS